ncbi:MAG TPA: PilZ domain-containing protein [Candidatus Acidoferrales bacterium]|nr:PilZ domain-containing protein [Candidatus Acidoferrales bacterium]
MTRKRTSQKKYNPSDKRAEPRVQGLRHITISYEGRDEQIQVKPPDLSIHGMFISTGTIFAEGTVLNLRFQLAHSGVEVETRGEVRYCLPGVGVGVEFIGVSREAEQEISREIDCQTEVRSSAGNNGDSNRGRPAITRNARASRLRRLRKR